MYVVMKDDNFRKSQLSKRVGRR